MVRKLILTFNVTNERTTEGATKGVLFFTGKHLNNTWIQISQENSCAGVIISYSCRPQACNFKKTETQTQVFSCEFFKTFKNTCGRLLQLVQLWVCFHCQRLMSKTKIIQKSTLLTFILRLWAGNMTSLKIKNIFQYKTTDSLRKTFQIKNNQSLFMGMTVNYFV